MSQATQEYELIPFRMHPRVFAALGADLVTNDVVAVIELVKNSYDAFASNLWIRFNVDGDQFLEIEDDGTGMGRSVIEDVWCLVATPFKVENPVAKRGTKTRRVAGEKGLGRLSAARLGTRLHMLTQKRGEPCWEIEVNWGDMANEHELSACYVRCREYPDSSPFRKSGTRLRILGLKAHWDEDRLNDLQENLARLISPFSELGEFNIRLSQSDQNEITEIVVESPEFLSKPKYSIVGEVDNLGNIQATYRFAPIRDGSPRRKKLKLSWSQVYDLIKDERRVPFSDDKPHCGPFTFNIRAWDIGSEGTQEISDKFDFQKNSVRRAIRAHKGISIYRDGVLVLPKSDNARDWLGLDLRRVSKVGTRMSTSQLVGYVSISAEDNPYIDDTSDRERLASRLETAEFEELLKSIIGRLENERDEDRVRNIPEKPLEDLFADLNAEDLLAEVITLADEGEEMAEAVPMLRAFSSSLDIARKAIQERFVYYSRLATVGTIAQMLVHEIRNRTIAFGAFLNFVKTRFGPFNDDDVAKNYRWADDAVNALEQLADTFSPLASRAFRRRKRESVIEERIHECINLNCGELERKKIDWHVPKTHTTVAVDPGELDAILLNLINNSLYWIGQANAKEREIDFRVTSIDNGARVRVWVHDNGPGIDDEDVDKILWPGVTRKPGGIGMGLTVASELVAEYGGRMTIKHPGTKCGASIAFDLPVKT